MIETRKKAGKDAAIVRFAEGTVSKFVETKTGHELRIACGKKESLPLSRRKAVLFLRKIVATAKQNKIRSLSLSWSEVRKLVHTDVSDAQLGEMMAVAFAMANFAFTVYKKKGKNDYAGVERVFVIGAPKEALAGIQRGEIVGTEVNGCRMLANTPGGDMTPKKLVAAAKVALKGTSVTLKVLGRKEMQKLGMGAVLGIAQGSAEEPQFLIMEYRGEPSVKTKKRPIVLIGKGVTFDSGGLNIKTGSNMSEMHMDMSGGSAVIHAIAAAARLKLPTHIIALVAAVENMPSGTAVRPGDIIKSLSGKTIEIVDTDAEGRVTLADAITYAKRYDPRAIIECSTLTGASVVALGFQASGLMTTDEAVLKKLSALGEESGDYVWPFPMWEEYEEMLKSDFADVANVPTGGWSRRAGVTGGGMFLQEFAKDIRCPFVHLDIAPRMTSDKDEYLAPGAAGAPVRLLLKAVESL